MKNSKQLESERKQIEKIMSLNLPKEIESDLCYKVIGDETFKMEYARTFQVEYSLDGDLKTVDFQAVNESDALDQLNRSGLDYDFVINFGIKPSENRKKLTVDTGKQVIEYCQ